MTMNRKTRKAAALYSDDNSHNIAAKAWAMSETERAEVSVVGIFPACDAAYARQTDELYRYSTAIGAPMTVLYGARPALTLMEYVRKNRVTDLIISESDTSGAARLIAEMLPKVRITTIPTESHERKDKAAAGFRCAFMQV